MRGKEGRKMVEAALVGDTRLVQKYLDEGVPADSRDDGGYTALHNAATLGSEEMVSLLIRAGADINAEIESDIDAGGATPLMCAAMASRTESPSIVSTLIQAGADPNARDAGGRTALIWCAMRSGDAGIAQALLDGGADPNAEDNTRSTAYAHARYEGNSDVADLLETITTSKSGQFSMEITRAIAERNHDRLARLLNEGADPGGTDPDGTTPLQMAAERSDLKATQVLLKAGADPDRHLDEMPTALHLAAAAGALDVVMALVDAGADVNMTSEGLTPLDYALEAGHDRIAAYLEQKGGKRWQVENARGLATPDVNEFALLIKAPLDPVSEAFADIRSARKLEKDIGGRPVVTPAEGYLSFRLKGHEWTLIEALYYDIMTQAGLTEKDAQRLSERLGAPVIFFQMSDTAYAIGYRFYENGQEIESFSFSPGYGEFEEPEGDYGPEETAEDLEEDLVIEFESQRRTVESDRLNEGFRFVHDFLVEQNAFVPGWSETSRMSGSAGEERTIEPVEGCPRIDLIAVR